MVGLIFPLAVEAHPLSTNKNTQKSYRDFFFNSVYNFKILICIRNEIKWSSLFNCILLTQLLKRRSITTTRSPSPLAVWLDELLESPVWDLSVSHNALNTTTKKYNFLLLCILNFLCSTYFFDSQKKVFIKQRKTTHTVHKTRKNKTLIIRIFVCIVSENSKKYVLFGCLDQSTRYSAFYTLLFVRIYIVRIGIMFTTKSDKFNANQLIINDQEYKSN